jgi:L,D-transpeptidase ErfK/SrfK
MRIQLNVLQRLRVIAIVALPFSIGACTTIGDFMHVMRSDPAEVAAPPAIEELPLSAPIDVHRFVIEGPQQSVVGIPQVVFTNEDDTLPDFALAYGIGYDELIAANPGVDPWLPGVDRPILLPTQFVLPDVPREGIVLNIAAKRLFYFPADGVERDEATGEIVRQTVLTFPIGIGRVGWETPLGETKVVSKAKDPTWWVPASVRQEHAEIGDPLPAVVPPGPDNPLGNRVLKLDIPGYLIHGTNQPFGVGMRVSHGCVRLYPENIEFLYELVEVGEPVRIINEPYLFGELDGTWYFESHAPLEDDTVPARHRLDAVVAVAEEQLADPVAAEHMRTIANAKTGVPVPVSAAQAIDFQSRVRRVENIIAVDPEAPTLEEVRAMIDEAVAEARAEEEASAASGAINETAAN